MNAQELLQTLSETSEAELIQTASYDLSIFFPVGSYDNAIHSNEDDLRRIAAHDLRISTPAGRYDNAMQSNDESAWQRSEIFEDDLRQTASYDLNYWDPVDNGMHSNDNLTWQHSWNLEDEWRQDNSPDLSYWHTVGRSDNARRSNDDSNGQRSDSFENESRQTDLPLGFELGSSGNAMQSNVESIRQPKKLTSIEKMKLLWDKIKTMYQVSVVANIYRLQQPPSQAEARDYLFKAFHENSSKNCEHKFYSWSVTKKKLNIKDFKKWYSNHISPFFESDKVALCELNEKVWKTQEYWRLNPREGILDPLRSKEQFWIHDSLLYLSEQRHKNSSEIGETFEPYIVVSVVLPPKEGDELSRDIQNLWKKLVYIYSAFPMDDEDNSMDTAE